MEVFNMSLMIQQFHSEVIIQELQGPTTTISQDQGYSYHHYHNMKSWKQLKCPPTGENTNKLVYVYAQNTTQMIMTCNKDGTHRYDA